MKRIFFCLIICTSRLSAQTVLPLFVELTDTVQPRFHEYDCGWEQRGDMLVHKLCRDSIGIDSFTLIRFFWINDGKKQYSSLFETKKKEKK